MTPHDTSTSSQSTQQTTTPTDWASIIEKGAGAAANLYGMSDKTMKKDITPTGQSVGGVPSYSYRFKGEPDSSPKILGPMAQDVQKVAPGAVKRIGGKLAVHAPTLAAFTPASPPVAKALSTFMPPVGSGSGTTAMRAGARGIKGALANTKLRRPRIAGGLSAYRWLRRPPAISAWHWHDWRNPIPLGFGHARQVLVGSLWRLSGNAGRADGRLGASSRRDPNRQQCHRGPAAGPEPHRHHDPFGFRLEP